MNDVHPDDELLVALALEDVDDSERESTLQHLATCQRCRNEYDAFWAAIEQALAAAPTVEPSPGFDIRALTAMGIHVGPVERSGRGQRRWRLVAAALVLGLALGAGGALALSDATDPSQATLADGGTHLETSDGEQVGTVTPSHAKGKPVLVVTVTSGPPGMEYMCLLKLEDGGQVESATWVLGPEPSETWVVETHGEAVSEVELVANGGKGPVWSTAKL